MSACYDTPQMNGCAGWEHALLLQCSQNLFIFFNTFVRKDLNGIYILVHFILYFGIATVELLFVTKSHLKRATFSFQK